MPEIEVFPPADKQTGYSEYLSNGTGYTAQQRGYPDSEMPSEANTAAMQARLDLLRNGRDPLNAGGPPVTSLPEMRVVCYYTFNMIL